MKTTPGEEGKWFAAAKDAGLYEEARALDLSPASDMKRKKAKPPENSSSNNVSEPVWLHDDPRAVRTPYTEEELDDLVEGFIVGNGDAAAWKELVQRHGFEAAKEILRNGFIRNPQP